MPIFIFETTEDLSYRDSIQYSTRKCVFVVVAENSEEARKLVWEKGDDKVEIEEPIEVKDGEAGIVEYFVFHE